VFQGGCQKGTSVEKATGQVMDQVSEKSTDLSYVSLHPIDVVKGVGLNISSEPT
jgi:hypothetical protein